MAVYRTIELNPVRAARVDAPNLYRWSSVHGNLGSHVDTVLTPRDRCMALGRGDRLHGEAYREWLQEAITAEERALIRTHLARSVRSAACVSRGSSGRRSGGPSLRPSGRPTAIEFEVAITGQQIVLGIHQTGVARSVRNLLIMRSAEVRIPLGSARSLLRGRLSQTRDSQGE